MSTLSFYFLVKIKHHLPRERKRIRKQILRLGFRPEKMKDLLYIEKHILQC